MKLRYDADGDVLVIYFNEGKIVESDEDENRPGIIYDLDAQKNIVSMEILSASKRISDLGRVVFDFPMQSQMATA